MIIIVDIYSMGSENPISTMTSLTAMQKNWVLNTEEGNITGVLIWDIFEG